MIFLRKSLDKRNGCVVTLRVRIYTKIYDVMGKVVNNKDESKFINTLKDIVKSARHFAYSSINLAQLRQNWLIGQNLVIQEQNGNDRAEYGKHVIEIASATLTAEYGKGFSKRNLWKFKQFYLTFKDLQIVPTVSAESMPLLSWSHYERLLRVKDSKVRKWYEEEATKQMWSYRTLDRNISTLYYHNPTIGILLCTETDKTIARYSVLNDNKQLFASQYMNYLPSEEELIQVIEQQREIFLSQNKT